MTGPSRRPVQEPPLPGTQVAIALTARPDDRAVIRVVAAARRDLPGSTAAGGPLGPFLRSLLVDVWVRNRLVLPGAWVQPEVISRGEPVSPRPVRPADLRPPAVITGEGESAELHWGQTVWPLALGGPLAIPEAARADPHPLARLRRLILIALDRHADVGLTLWRGPDFEVPWHDVRLIPRAAWWFEIAQVPAGMRYADAEAAQGVGRSRPGP